MEQTFVGRESELAFLAQDMDWIATGRPRLTVVRGDPGIGKTSVVAAI